MPSQYLHILVDNHELRGTGIRGQDTETSATKQMPENIDAVTNLSRLDIMQVQARLSALGYDVGRPDGIWGAKTRDSIKAWQGTQGFNVTGELTKHQLDELRVIR